MKMKNNILIVMLIFTILVSNLAFGEIADKQLHYSFDSDTITGDLIEDLESADGYSHIYNKGAFNSPSGVYGQSMSFDGNSDYLHSNSVDWTNDGFGAISLWFKSQNNTKNTLFQYRGSESDEDNQFTVSIVNSDIRIYSLTDLVPSPIITFDVNVSLNVWHKLIITHESAGDLYLYYDSVLIGSSSTGGWFTDWDGLAQTPLNLTIGASMVGEYGEGVSLRNYFKGNIDEFEYYAQYLVQDNITEIYTLGTSNLNIQSYTNPSYVWDMNSSIDLINGEVFDHNSATRTDTGCLNDGCMTFDQTHFIEESALIHSLEDGNNFTICMWANFTGLQTATASIFGSWQVAGGYYYYKNSNVWNSRFQWRNGGYEPYMSPTHQNNYYLYCLVQDNDQSRIFHVNQTSVVTSNWLDYNLASPSDLVIGRRTDNYAGWIGQIDEFYYYPFALDSNNITQLATDGYNDLFYPYPSAEVLSSDLTIIKSNLTGIIKDVYGEGEYFNIFGNWTRNDGTSINSTVGECNFTIFDICVGGFASDTNFSICEGGCDYVTYSEVVTPPTTTGALFDGVKFNVCHSQSVVADLDISLSCSGSNVTQTITASQIPRCDVSTSLFILNYTGCIDETDLQLNLNSNGNNPTQSLRVTDLDINRFYDEHLMEYNEFTFYNYSSNLWYITHPHRCFNQGSKQIDLNCISSETSDYDNFETDSITIVNSPPSLTFDYIMSSFGLFNFTENGFYEYPFAWVTFGVIVSNNDISSIVMNITNTSNDIIYSQICAPHCDPIIINGSVFRDAGNNPYSFNVFAIDEYNDTISDSRTFNIVDTIDPFCNNLDDYSTSIANYSYSWTSSCVDESFFSFNMSCDNGYFFSEVGMNTTQYLFNQTMIINNPVVSCSYEYCDGHTNRKLEKDWYIFKKDKEIKFKIGKNSHTLKGDGDVKSIDYLLLNDRVEFTVNLNRKVPLYFRFEYSTSPNSYYIESDTYTSWIIDYDSRTWFDLNSDNKNVTVDVSRYNETLWILDVYPNSDIESIKFKSIGELNCIEGIQEFTYTPPPVGLWGSMTDQTCPLDQDLSYIVGFLGIFGIMTGLYLFNKLALDIPIFSIFAGVAFIGLSLPFYGCTIWFGIPVTLFGIFVLLSESFSR